MKQRKLLLTLLILLFATFTFAQKGYFQMRGRIYNKSKQTLDNASIKLFEGKTLIGEDKTSSKGVFSLRFKFNKDYTVEISKDGYATKKLKVETQVPKDKQDKYFDLFNIILLDKKNEADALTKKGLPVSRYFYNKAVGDFSGEKLAEKTKVTNNNIANANVAKLQAELNDYKILFEEQKKVIQEAERINAEASLIKAKAELYADSMVEVARQKSVVILGMTDDEDTSNFFVEKAVESVTKEISMEDFDKFVVDKKQFESKKSIKQLQDRVEELSKKGEISDEDSLQLKENRLSLRKELFELARFRLEEDRMKASTAEEKKKIEEREAELLLMQQQINITEQELATARTQLEKTELELRNKNIMLWSFVGGSVLLLIILGIIYYNYRDKKRINKLLEYQNQELEKLSIVASETSNAVIITDKDGKFTWVNDGYTRLFGYTLDEVTNENQRCLINNQNNQHVNDLITKSQSEGVTVNYEFETSSKTGEKIWVQTTVTPILDKAGKVSKMIAIDSDISEVKKAEQEILAQSRQIMASINYGKRIQDAILPSESLIKSYFPDSFIYFKPRDIVSGDFYWFSVQQDKLFVAAVDCTGHGVPGAFMSLIGNQLLNHIVNERKIYQPSEILKELNKGVIRALSQSDQENEEREDGMDLTICRFDKKKKEVQVACANHTALILNGEEEIQEIEGDEISIGETYSKVDNLEFTNHEISFNSNSVIYLFSDGYPDQLGGPKNKRFLVGKFKNFLVEHQKEAMEMQFDKLNETFNIWKGDNKQTDDILVMGIRLSGV